VIMKNILFKTVSFLLLLSIGLFCLSTTTRVVSAQSEQYTYDSLNRLVEIRSSDKVIHYAYDDAGNRTGITIENLVAVPLTTSLSPNNAMVSGSGFILIVSGDNFASNSIVQWNGMNRPTTFNNVNQLTATISSSDISAIGTASVTVLNQATTSISNTQTFTIQAGGSCIPASIASNIPAPTGTTITIPVTASDLTGRGVDAYNFVLSFDPNILQPRPVAPVDAAGTLSSGFNITTDVASSGQLKVGAYGTTSLSGSGTLLKLSFNVIGTSGTGSTLTWSEFQLKEGDPCAAPANGSVSVTANNEISGNVTYGIVGAQGTKIVPNVALTASGTSQATATSNSSGDYTFTGLASGSYTVTPTKSGDVNGISSFDSTLVLRYVAAGGGTLSPSQQIAADTNGNSTITSFDATQILRYVAAGGSTAQTGFAGIWKFSPQAHNYASLTNSLANENFNAFLIGEVNGNWTPPGAFAENAESDTEIKQPVVTESIPPVKSGENKIDAQASPLTGVQISLPANAAAMNGRTVTIPVMLSNNNSKAISSYSFAVLFNQNGLVLQPASPAFDRTGTLTTNDFTVVSDTNTPGRLGIAVASANSTITGSGTLLNLRFTVVGQQGNTTALNFSNPVFEDDNGDAVTVTPTNGAFTVTGPTAASVSLGGRITTSNGLAIVKAKVTLTNSSGESRTALSNPFGYYRFTDVPIGETYVISVFSKQGYQFTPQVLNITEELNEVNFSAEP
jgi:YD repeat-containing protein